VSVNPLLADSNVPVFLDSHRNKTMAQICHDAEMKVANIYIERLFYEDFSLTGRDQYSKMHLCSQAIRKLGFYMTCLASVELWPLQFHSGSLSVEETPPKCNCNACEVDMTKDLTRVVEKHKKELKGVCLGCIKEGSYSRNAFRKSCSKHGLRMGD
jgi:hypothetical protein